MSIQRHRPPLPDSLKRKRNLKIIIRLLVCFILLGLSFTAIFLWGERLFPIAEGRMQCYVILVLFPFLVTEVPTKFIDTAWSGPVTDVKVVEVIDAHTRGVGYLGCHYKEKLVLSIKTDTNKDIEYTAFYLNKKMYVFQDVVKNLGKIEYHTDKFLVGERVHKYYGFENLFVENKMPQNNKICIVCGSSNEDKDEKCWYCGSELIK